MWAEWPHNPYLLRVPNAKRMNKIRSGYLTTTSME